MEIDKKDISKTGFKTPSDYFDYFESKLMEELDLSRMPKKNGFKVPSQYFESLERDITSKVNSDKKKIIFFKDYNYFKIISLSIAASLLLFFSFSNFYSQKNKTDFNKITASDIDGWIESDLVTFQNYDIYESLPSSDLDFMTSNASDEILEYLENTNVESLILEN